ncbi:protein mitoshell isoform X3 [Hermetia illucens]|nr:protein mitoshell isoform X3 [Hermetia illucens]
MNNQTQVDLRLGGANDNISSHVNCPGSMNSNNMDRLRISNLMAQDFHSFWPYGQFMSPVCPPGVAMFPTPYPLPLYQSNNIPSNYDNPQARFMPNTGANTRNVEPNNMTIQIGVQCMNHNNPVNINALNDLTMPLPKSPGEPETAMNNRKLPSTLLQREGRISDLHPPVSSVELPYGSTTVPNPYHDKSNGIDAVFAKDFEKKFGNRFSFDMSDGPAMIDMSSLCQEKFSELTRMAMRGCELAERLAYTHRNRPCFKKIDSLCARMKQDLIRPDGVLPNINSQGIAWAVKDFIFVFTRIINAWIIIKGYVYNTPEGLTKVKSALSPDFTKSFAAWQDATMDFVENIIKSFLSLDHLVQSQKAAFQKMDSTMKASSTPLKKPPNVNSDLNGTNQKLNFKMFDDSYDFLNDNVSTDSNPKQTSILNESSNNALNKSYFSTLVEDSEETQRKATANGTYFKTGVYNPLQKESNSGLDSSTSSKKDIVVDSPIDPCIGKTFNNSGADEVNLLWPNTTPILDTCNQSVTSSPINGEGDGKQQSIPQQSISNPPCGGGNGLPPVPIGVPPNHNSLNMKPGNDWLPFEFRVLEKNLTNFSSAFDPTITKPIGSDLTEKLEVLLQRISNLSEGKYFFTAHFTRNYFPDFTAKYPNFMDLRSIILKAQVGGYSHIFEIVHDLKLIIYHAKIYLKINPNDLLKNSIAEYEKEIDNILTEKLFKNWQFDHISGDPNESIFPTTI